MTLPRLSLLLALLGGLLVAAALAIGGDTSWFDTIEGAYFTRAAGTPAYSGVFSGSFNPDGPQLLSLHDGNLLLGAGIALLLAALTTVVAHWRGLRLVRAIPST
ncbi:MAG: hypothetical protein ACJ76L_10930 [Conexibacter sp.]